jgi:DNA polymerase-3 subunit alpha
VNAKEAFDIDRVIETRASKLVIRWREGTNGALNANHLKHTLEPFRPGSCAVSLFYQRANAEARVSLGGSWSVRPSRELREQLSGLVGWDGFRFIYETAGFDDK